MNAWQRLLAASSLAIGNAWDLITHPRTGGTGVIINTGAVALVADNPLAVALADGAVAVALSDPAVAVTVLDAPLSVTMTTPDNRAAVADNPLTIRTTP